MREDTDLRRTSSASNQKGKCRLLLKVYECKFLKIYTVPGMMNYAEF